MGPHRNWWLGLLLVGGTLLVYLPVWHAGFIWDDDSFVVSNPLIHRAEGLRQFWFSTQPVDYFPLTSTMLWVEWRLWGANPLGYHVVNVLLHALSAVLLWRVLARLRIPGAWLAAGIFAVHPVNVESVAWITERKNTLAMVFYLLSLFGYLRSEPDPRPSTLDPRTSNGCAWRWYGFSLAMFACSLLSKTAVAPLPLVLLGLAWWRRGRVALKDVWRSVPFFALAAVVGLVSWWFQSHRAIGPEVIRSDSFWSRMAGAGWAVWFYLYKAALPLNLSIYPLWKIDPAKVMSYLPGLMLVGALLMCWLFRRTWGRAWLCELGYFVVMLLPVLGFLNIYYMRYSLVADHWQYFALIGPIALVAAGLGSRFGVRAAGGGFPHMVIVAAPLLALLGILTWRQCGMYADAVTFWRRTMAANPECWMAHNNLGKTLFEEGQVDQALAHFQKAVELRPNHAEARNNLGNALLRKGQVQEAMTQFQEAIKLRPDLSEARNSLAGVLYRMGRVDDAVAQLKIALTYTPDDEQAHNNLGNILLDRGHVAEAIAQYQRALDAHPNSAASHYNLADALFEQRRLDEALIHYQKAAELQPGFAEAQNSLGLVLFEKGRVDEALVHYQKALEIRPRFAKAHHNLAEALLRKGQPREALTHYQAALEIRPDFTPTSNRLAWVLATCPDATLRNGPKALEIARQLDQLGGGNNPLFLQTLAAAYAETGQFSEAVAFAERAQQLAASRNDTSLANSLRNQLERYQAGSPFRETYPTAPPETHPGP
jgi:tetratricopeptide (TPR) repeat protein